MMMQVAINAKDNTELVEKLNKMLFTDYPEVEWFNITGSIGNGNTTNRYAFLYNREEVMNFIKANS